MTLFWSTVKLQIAGGRGRVGIGLLDVLDEEVKLLGNLFDRLALDHVVEAAKEYNLQLLQNEVSGAPLSDIFFLDPHDITRYFAI